MDINSFVIGLAKGKKSGYFSTKENDAGGLTYAFKAKESEGGELSEKDVNFYDYDGTLLHSYTVAEAQALTELPELPTQEGLTCQGWNYDLETIKDYNGAVDVGAVYITDDGKTRLYINIIDDYRMTISLYFVQSVDNGVIVDWGDGTTPQTYTGTSASAERTHTYESVGEYIITLEPIGDCVLTLGTNETSTYNAHAVLGGSKSLGCSFYQNGMLRKVEIGKNVNKISVKSFYRNKSLETVTIPYGITEFADFAFETCVSLKSMIIPNGVSMVGAYAFSGASSCKVLSIPSSITTVGNNAFQKTNLERVVIPNALTSVGTYVFSESWLKQVIVSNGVEKLGNYMFAGCNFLEELTLPESLTSIGTYCFHNNKALKTVKIPNGITSIPGYCFAGSNLLESVIIPDSVHSIDTYAFSGCPLRDVTLPNGLTTIGDRAFQSNSYIRNIKFPNGTKVGDAVLTLCGFLEYINFPEGKTSLGASEFYNCYSLVDVKLPSTIESISNSAFDGCSSLLSVDFTKCTSVPTVSNANAFYNMCAYVKFYVPAALIDEWKAATNWSTVASKIEGV